MQNTKIMAYDKTNLPAAPKELCFSENEFIQSNFDVDAFLQDHRKTVKLETMRDDLGIYLKLLRSAMIDLINRDYADFVNLSSNLIGLDKAINGLEIPLGQLREEVMQIQQTLEDEIEALSNALDENCKVRLCKQSLYSLQHVYKSLQKLSGMLSMNNYLESLIKVDVLEQAVAELNQLKFHLSRCKSDVSAKLEAETKTLEDLLINHLNELFLVCIYEKDSILLTRCLRIYILLDKIETVESVVRKNVISPLVNNIIKDEDSQSELTDLQSLYQRFLNILSGELKQLLDITLSPNRISVQGFNFLANSFWIEIEEDVDQQMKYIFAPGDPQLFHKRYTETMWFRKKLEEMYDTPMSVNTLSKHPRYKNFLKKWNLLVYFQIRFQEIAGSVETVLREPVSSEMIKETTTSLLTEDFSLHTTCIVWNSLHRIWSSDVYLCQLFQKFWKLSLQICARYQTWINATVKQVWLDSCKVNNTSEITSYTRLDFLVHLHCDVEKFVNMLPRLLQLVQSKVPNQTSIISELLEGCLNETSTSLENMLPLTTDEIVNELLTQCAIHLKQVSDIPRLFRRTNREVPTKPCAYVKNTLEFLSTFRRNYNSVIPTKIEKWLELTLSLLTERYLMSVTDVLISVQKTEESLRRLKRIRDKSVGALPADIQGVSDDEKIRIQLQVDVRAYAALINDLEVPISNVSHLDELTQAIEAALKK